MKYIVILLLGIYSIARGDSPDDMSRRYKIFHVSLDIPMDDDDENRKEFFVNIGSNQGIKKGVVLSVYRTVSIPDQFEGRIPRDTYIKIATLRVKSSEYDSSIAELVAMEKDRPILDVDSIMLGDEVQIEFKEEHPI